MDQARGLLQRTPAVLRALVGNLPESWELNNEGGESFSPFDVVGHLILGEETDWMARAKIILHEGPARPFDPFDRFAMRERNRGKTMGELLDLFENLRKKNLLELDRLEIAKEQFELKGTHPALGEVNLKNLLATWVVHDLGHIAQVARVMAKQYSHDVGPWKEYLPILHR